MNYKSLSIVLIILPLVQQVETSVKDSLIRVNPISSENNCGGRCFIDVKSI